MMEYKTITTPSGSIIKIPDQIIVPTKEQLLEELTQEYLRKIRDAKDLLGDNDPEITRLQAEYQQKKLELEAQ